ncbi:unnamed protein product, partial [Ixodes hexagonus]
SQPPERGVPPVKQPRPEEAGSAEGAELGALGRGGTPPKKASVRRLDEDALKRSRLHSNQYELSQDLLDKQVEMLERKYGGVRARTAALTIQRAFRSHCMQKRFLDLASASKGERRLSRRIHALDLLSQDGGGTSSLRHHQYGWTRGSPTPPPSEGSQRRVPPQVPRRTSAGSKLAPTLQTQISFAEVSSASVSEERGLARYEASLSSENRTKHLRITKTRSGCGGSRSTVPGRRLRVVCLASLPRMRRKWIVSSIGASVGSGVCYRPPSLLCHRQDRNVRQCDTYVTSPGESQQSSSEDTVNVPVGDTSQAQHSRLSPALFPCLPKTIRAATPDLWFSRELLFVALSHQRIRTKPNDEGARQPIASDGAPGGLIRAGSQRACGVRLPFPPPGWVWDMSPQAVAPNQSPVPPAATGATTTSPSPLAAVPAGLRLEDKRLSNISENSEDSLDCAAYSCSPSASDVLLLYPHQGVGGNRDSMGSGKGSEAQRKRQYRVGLNLFNKRPEKGVRYLVDRGFLDACPRAVARFLVSRKGLSKLMIGDYLGNLQCPFNMRVLECFVQELDFAGMQVDLALRKFQSYFILPGEAQKIERLVEVFSHQYAQCNPDVVAKLRSADTLFVLAFSVVLLNTDLHTPSVKADKRMKLDDYVRNLRGVDEGHDMDRDMLAGIYERIKAHPFRPGSDHVSQVLKVQQSIVGKKP